jgi:hypothetical protein
MTTIVSCTDKRKELKGKFSLADTVLSILLKVKVYLCNCCFAQIDRVDVKLPAIEVRYNNLHVEAECSITSGVHLPTLWNSTKGVFSVRQLFFFDKMLNAAAEVRQLLN